MKFYGYFQVSFLAVFLFFIQSVSAAEWRTSQSKMVLDKSNKYVSDFDVINDGEYPLYVGISQERIDTKDGLRTALVMTDGVVKVYPERFVVLPKSIFKVKVMSELNNLEGNSASYYLNVTDVSKIDGVDGVEEKIPMVAGVSLSYGVMVNVAKRVREDLSENGFSLLNVGEDLYRLENKSDRHVSLISARDCHNDQKDFFECPMLTDFSRQTLLPGELSPPFHMKNEKLVVSLTASIAPDAERIQLILKKSS